MLRRAWDGYRAVCCSGLLQLKTELPIADHQPQDCQRASHHGPAGGPAASRPADRVTAIGKNDLRQRGRLRHRRSAIRHITYDRNWPNAPIDEPRLNGRSRGVADGPLRRACDREGSKAPSSDRNRRLFDTARQGASFAQISCPQFSTPSGHGTTANAQFFAGKDSAML